MARSIFPEHGASPKSPGKSKKSPTGPTEWTPKLEYLIALVGTLPPRGPLKVRSRFPWGFQPLGFLRGPFRLVNQVPRRRSSTSQEEGGQEGLGKASKDGLLKSIYSECIS